MWSVDCGQNIEPLAVSRVARKGQKRLQLINRFFIIVHAQGQGWPVLRHDQHGGRHQAAAVAARLCAASECRQQPVGEVAATIVEPVHHLSQNPVIRQNVACNNKVIFNEMLDQSAILATAKDAWPGSPHNVSR